MTAEPKQTTPDLVAVAQSKAEAMGLSVGPTRFTSQDSVDPARLTRALWLLPATALLFWATALTPFALLPALAALLLFVRLAWPARRYFIAFSPRNRFPRNLPALARWAALYSGAMLVMIVLPPMPGSGQWAIWLALATACLAFPVTKAWLRARRIWGQGDDP
ncbi:MAG: hypothetical protein AAGH17_10445 [Pseudomonadota bacterium]